MLPIKTKDGIKERHMEVSDNEEGEEEENDDPTEDGSEEEAEDNEEDEEDNHVEAGTEVSVVELYARRKETLLEKKIQIGSLAASFLECPEERLVNLEKLVKMVDGHQPESVEVKLPVCVPS